MIEIRHVRIPEGKVGAHHSMLRILLQIGFVKLFKYGYGITRKGYAYFERNK